MDCQRKEENSFEEIVDARIPDTHHKEKNNGDVNDVVPYPAVSGVPIYDPTVPFVQNIGGLYPDNIIFIAGVPNPNPSRFTIYLQSGVHYEPQQIAMSFGARFVFGNDRHCIVRNHKYSNKWGMEERFAPYFPFRPNTYFEIIILVTPHCFKVAVNNHHFLEFKHRLLPLNLVDTLHIAGDVSLSQYVRSGYDDAKYPHDSAVPIYNPPIPFVQNTGRLNPNKMIFICGIPDPEASRFTVNLQNGPHADSELVAMTFDVRFMWGDPVSENCVVCTHKDGEYKFIDEERHSTYFPFKRNKQFEMIILVEARCFKVAVNNNHFIEFKHKIKPLSSIDTLSITGDVRLTQVRFQE